MRARILLLAMLLALPTLRCAEATYVEDDVPGTGDAEPKDTTPQEDLGEDAKAPPEDSAAPLDATVDPDVASPLEASVDAPIKAELPEMDAGITDLGGMDVVAPDLGPPDTGVVDTGTRDTGVIDTGPRDTGVVDTGVVDTGVVDTGVVDTGVAPDTGTFPPILCPLLGTPIPITCRSRNGLRPCCGIGGACFCEQSSPFGPLCLPCS